MIGHGLENGKVRQIFRAEQPAQFAEFFRHVFRLLRVTICTLANVPEKHFALGAVFQRNQTEVEHGEEFFPMLEGVVVVLSIILNRDRLAQVSKFNHDLRIVFFDFNGRDVFNDRFDFVEHVGHENRVICRKKTA